MKYFGIKLFFLAIYTINCDDNKANNNDKRELLTKLEPGNISSKLQFKKMIQANISLQHKKRVLIKDDYLGDEMLKNKKLYLYNKFDDKVYELEYEGCSLSHTLLNHNNRCSKKILNSEDNVQLDLGSLLKLTKNNNRNNNITYIYNIIPVTVNYKDDDNKKELEAVRAVFINKYHKLTKRIKSFIDKVKKSNISNPNKDNILKKCIKIKDDLELKYKLYHDNSDLELLKDKSEIELYNIESELSGLSEELATIINTKKTDTDIKDKIYNLNKDILQLDAEIEELFEEENKIETKKEELIEDVIGKQLSSTNTTHANELDTKLLELDLKANQIDTKIDKKISQKEDSKHKLQSLLSKEIKNTNDKDTLVNDLKIITNTTEIIKADIKKDKESLLKEQQKIEHVKTNKEAYHANPIYEDYIKEINNEIDKISVNIDTLNKNIKANNDTVKELEHDKELIDVKLDLINNKRVLRNNKN